MFANTDFERDVIERDRPAPHDGDVLELNESGFIHRDDFHDAGRELVPISNADIFQGGCY
jgi:hypothetical protein